MDKKEKIKEIFNHLINTHIAIIELYKDLAKEDKEKRQYRKLINKGKKAKDVINGIRHEEILLSLYNLFMQGKETYFAVIVATINHKNTVYWDTTDNGFQEFLELEKKNNEKYKKELEERKKQEETIKKAKEEGKKIEYVYQNGKIIPTVVDNDTKKA